MIFTSKSQKMMYTRIWEEIKKVINEVADNKLGDYSKDYRVIMFDSDDVLPLNSMINIHSLTVIIKSVFKDNNKFYPQIYTNLQIVGTTKSSLKELIKCSNTTELIFLKVLTLKNVMRRQENVVYASFIIS